MRWYATTPRAALDVRLHPLDAARPAMGGTRMKLYDEPAEALEDGSGSPRG